MLCDEYTQFISATRTSQKRQLKAQTCIIEYAQTGILSVDINDSIIDIYIIKEKLETLTSMESYLPTSNRHAASWIFSDGPSKQLGVVKLRYNALKLFFIMSLFYANVPVSASDSHSRQFISLTQAQL